MKRKALSLFAIAVVFAIQLNIKTTKNGADVKLDQIIQEAEACFEVGGQNYQCCPATSWCYIGGGFEAYPYDFDF